MVQTTSPAGGRIARTETFAATLVRAADYAAGPMHGAVTLEHLLLALTEDDDAVGVLLGSNVDLGRLRNEVAAFIGQQQYPALPQGMRPGPDAELTKILTYAEAASRQSGRTEINGAIVLAAIVGEGRSMAATFLKAQGLTFQAAIKVIQQVLAPEPTPPAPAVPPAEPAVDILSGSPQEIAETSAQPEPEPPPSPAPVLEPPPPTDDDIANSMQERRRETSDAAILSGTRAPPIQKPLWEPVGIPSIRRVEPPARPTPPARPPAPATPAASDRPAVTEPTPAPAPPPPEPAANDIASESASSLPPPARVPPRPTPDLDTARPAPPAALTENMRPAPSVGERLDPTRAPVPASTGRPPPLPPGRRPPDGPSQPPPAGGGLGAARPPAPRPSLRLPPNPVEGHQITAPWPEPNDIRPPAPQPPRPMGPPPAYPPPPPNARAPHTEHDPRAPRGAPPPPMGRGHAPPQRAPAAEQGQLIENIPRRMKVGVIESFEVRIAREDVVDAGRGMAGRGAPQQHAILVTRAMSVRLQGETGRFYIETSSPETQWTGSRNEHLTSEYAVWRFSVIPQRRGPANLTLIVSSRTIGADGIVADTSLPEQKITIRVSANVTRGAKKWLGWIAVAVLGGVMAKLGEGFWEQGLALVRRLLNI